MNLPTPEPLLEIKGLKTYFYMREGIAKAVDNVSLEIKPGETLGIAGESGCGKSVTALSIIRLLQEPPARIVGGEINFSSRGDLTKLTQAEMRKIRGNEISMIFQEPMTSLNPVFRIGRQMSETIRVHQNVSAKEAFNRTVELLKMVGLSAPEKQIKDYPHQLSGGMRQRVMIAIGLACNPKLIIADEPTTALDVTIQAQILELMHELRDETGASVILITHDLGVVAEIAHRVVVMYAGRKVEEAPIEELFAAPRHPYTRGLLGSMPHLGDSVNETGKRLVEIPGMVPSLKDPAPGCLFAPRCPNATVRCVREEPPLELHAPGHWAACWNPVAAPRSTVTMAGAA